MDQTSLRAERLPVIIQGGMGVGISHWGLARTVSRLGQLGVVSGTALDQLLARRLQQGDPEGHMRRALDRFPDQAMATRVWDEYYIRGGRRPNQAYHQPPMQEKDDSRALVELRVVANFVEVFLAKAGHHGQVGINYLEKIQIPHLASIYGAMLAGVDVILMGAGIPLRIPGVLDRLARHEAVSYPLTVTGVQPGDDVEVRFDPAELGIGDGTPLRRPRFLAIVASDVLAHTLHRRANGQVDGFVVEGPTAGGHNAPPRGRLQVNERGEPVYGERDTVDLDRLRGLGLPFWLAGGYGSAEGLRRALELGAAGVQVGTAFAYCSDSGLRSDYRKAVLRAVIGQSEDVFTDPLASPTGFPFKVVRVPGSISEPDVADARPRVCDLGFLREAYRREDGTIGFRCPSEPVNVYVSKGGSEEDTVGRRCLCNALVASAGFPQVRAGRLVEAGVVTAGDDLHGLRRFLLRRNRDYSAADVVATLLAGLPQQAR